MDTATRRNRLAPISMVLPAIAVAAFVHLPGLLNTRPLDDDETYLASMGKMLRAGDVLYRDVIDRKPPLVIWAYQFLVPQSWDMRPIRVVTTLLIALNGVVLYSIAKRLGLSHNGARTAGALAIIGSALAGFSDAQAANFEVWGLPAASASVLCALIATNFQASFARFSGIFASGALAGVATNCKQPYVFTLIVIALIFPRGHRVLRSTIATAGLLTVTGLVAILSGWARYWKWVWFENGDYINIGGATLATLAVRQCLVFMLVQWPLSTTVLASLRTTTAKIHHPTPEQLVARRIGFLWFAAAMLGVASGLRFFGHYFQQCVPPLALLAATALDAQHQRARRRTAIAAGFAPLLWTLAWVPGFAGLDAAPPALARGVAEQTAPNDRVLIWGRLPNAAAQARRTPTGRFVHQAYLTGSWASVDGVADPAETAPYAQRWNQYLAGLVQAPPAIIVDASPIVEGWQRYSIDRLPLQRLIDVCYRPIEDIDKLHAYKRTGSSCAAAVSRRGDS